MDDSGLGHGTGERPEMSGDVIANMLTDNIETPCHAELMEAPATEV